MFNTITFFKKIRISRNITGYLLLLLCCLISSPDLLQAQGLTVYAKLSPNQFPVDQAATLTVTIQGNNQGKPTHPQGKGLSFNYQGQNTQMQWINGKTSSSISFAFLVQADQMGPHTIEPITIQIGKTKYQTKAIRCTVLPPTSATRSSRNLGGTAVPPQSSTTRLRSGEADKIGFMRILPQKKVIYSGELVPFTIKAFFRQGIRATLKSNPRIQDNNFILNGRDNKPLQTEEQINGIVYTVLTWNGTISGVKEGVFPLEVEMDASLLVRAQRQHPSSMFGSPLFNDPFFDDFFSGFSRKDITLISPRISLRVKDLPIKGKPKNFTGAVGIFSLAVKAQPTTVKTGDPITLKMRIQGSGNFDRVHAPTFPKNNNWKSYKPSSKPVETKQGKGQKEFEQAIIPLNNLTHAIPALQFSYFDPHQKSYVNLSSDPIPITIQGISTSSIDRQQIQNKTTKEQVNKKQQTPVSNQTPIKSDFGKAVSKLRPIYEALWFQLFMALSLLILLSAVVLIRQEQLRKAHPGRASKKVLNRSLQQLFSQAQQAQEAKDSALFYSICRQILQQWFAFSWQREAQSICTADVEQHLSKDSPLPSIFKQAEHATYSGETISQQEMAKILTILQKEIRQL